MNQVSLFKDLALQVPGHLVILPKVLYILIKCPLKFSPSLRFPLHSHQCKSCLENAKCNLENKHKLANKI